MSDFDNNDETLDDAELEQPKREVSRKDHDPFLVEQATRLRYIEFRSYTGLRRRLDKAELALAKDVGDLVHLVDRPLPVIEMVAEINARNGQDIEWQTLAVRASRAIAKVDSYFLKTILRGKGKGDMNNLAQLGHWYNFVVTRPEFQKNQEA